MRLKLLLLASLLAAIVGAGTSIAITLFFSAPLRPPSALGLLAALTLIIPILAVFLASLFVYRHTARRRRLQAILTALLSILLSLFVFVLASILTSRSQPITPPDQTIPTDVGQIRQMMVRPPDSILSPSG